MAKKRLMSLDDLYSYYANQSESVHFDANNDNSVIVVQVPGKVSFDDEDTRLGLLPVTLQACHIGKNLNGSSISEDAMNTALPSFSNRPILGYIHEVDGQDEFETHNSHLDDDGNVVYDEIPVGVIPESCNARIEHDDDQDKDYVVVDGYIYEEYTKAAEILQREKKCSVSIEINILEFSYDAKEKALNIDKFIFSGVTILGKRDDGTKVNPGMAGANITMSDFSAENNSMLNDDVLSKIVERLDKFEEKLASLNIKYSGEGGKKLVDKFNELLKKYNKTAEDVTFDYEGLSDEELEAKFAEAFEDQPDDPVDPAEPTDPADPVEPTETTEPVEATAYAIKMSDGSMKEFSLSMDDIQRAIFNLVNETYGSDDAWYSVTVYPDESKVIMDDWYTRSNYRQAYERNDSNFSLVGERVPVHQIWVTDEEDNDIKNLKSNYSEIEKELSTYKKNEDTAKKQELLNSNEFASIANSEDVQKIVEDTESFNEMTSAEFEQKLNEILLTYAKEGKLNFAEHTPSAPTTKKVGLPIHHEKSNGKFGGLFSKSMKAD